MGSRSRYLRGALAVAVAVAVASVAIAGDDAVVKAAPEAPEPGPPLDLEGDSFVDYLALDGDQVVVVPAGRYGGGTVSTARPPTDGPLKGWLVLIAEEPGEVVIDLSSEDLVLEQSTSRVLLVGFTFVDGAVWLRGEDLVLWHTDHTFPAEVWAAEDPRVHRAPRTIYVDKGARRVRLMGIDVWDTATAIVVARAEDITIQGAWVRDLGEKGLDRDDVVHSDAIGVGSGLVDDLQVLDSDLEGRALFSTEVGDIDVRMVDVWLHDGPGAGVIYGSVRTADGGYGKVTGLRRRVRSWGHSDVDRIDSYDGRFDKGPEFNDQPDRINVRDVSVQRSAPPPGEPSPAERWRADHPVEAWPLALAPAVELPEDLEVADDVSVEPRSADDDREVPVVPVVVGIAVLASALLWWRRSRDRLQ